MRKLIGLLRAHPVLAPAFVLAAALTAMFLVRTVVFTIYWADPAHRDRQIEPWMTPRYVAYSWDLEPETVARALGLPAPGRGRPWLPRRNLGEIARESGVPLAELAARIERAAAETRGPAE